MLLFRFYFVFVSPLGLDGKMTPEIVSALCWHCIYGAILLFSVLTRLQFLLTMSIWLFDAKNRWNDLTSNEISLTPVNGWKPQRYHVLRETCCTPSVRNFVKRSNSWNSLTRLQATKFRFLMLPFFVFAQHFLVLSHRRYFHLNSFLWDQFISF